jgi:hypothetical protein
MMQRMLPGLKKMCPGEVALLAMHGRVLWATNDHEIHEEDLVIRPVGLESNTAASMWGAWNAVLPESLMQALKGLPQSGLVALTPGSDSFSANEMLIHHVENLTSASADKVFVLPGFCQQHKTGNGMGPLVARTGILRPSNALRQIRKKVPAGKEGSAGTVPAAHQGIRAPCLVAQGAQQIYNWSENCGIWVYELASCSSHTATNYN